MIHKKTVTLAFEREVKHSVLYKGPDELKNVYLPKFTLLTPPWPKEVTITVEWSTKDAS